jgi:hypothetical protein
MTGKSLDATGNVLLNPLSAELNPICHLLALLGVHHFLHVSRIRVKDEPEIQHLNHPPTAMLDEAICVITHRSMNKCVGLVLRLHASVILTFDGVTLDSCPGPFLPQEKASNAR